MITFKRRNLVEDSIRPVYVYDAVKTSHPDILKELKLAHFVSIYSYTTYNALRIFRDRSDRSGVGGWSVFGIDTNSNDSCKFRPIRGGFATKKEAISYVNEFLTQTEYDFSNEVDCIGRPYFINGIRNANAI